MKFIGDLSQAILAGWWKGSQIGLGATEWTWDKVVKKVCIAYETEKEQMAK